MRNLKKVIALFLLLHLFLMILIGCSNSKMEESNAQRESDKEETYSENIKETDNNDRSENIEEADNNEQSKTTEETTNNRSLEDLEEYLKEFCVGERTEMAAYMIGAEKGFKYSNDSEEFEIYQFDIKSDEYKNVVSSGKIYMEDFDMYTDVESINQEFVLLITSNKELIEKFNSY